jgi:hypothetical protein
LPSTYNNLRSEKGYPRKAIFTTHFTFRLICDKILAQRTTLKAEPQSKLSPKRLSG